MKKIMLIISSLLLLSSVANADISQNISLETMNKADSQFLFDGSTNTIALSSQEMKQTEGEFWPIFWGITYFTVTYANTPSYGGQTYSGYPYARGRWKFLNW